MKHLKKIVAVMVAISVMVVGTAQVYAVGRPGGIYKGDDTAHPEFSNSSIETKFRANLTFPKLNKCKWVGTSYTTWWGSNPFYADSITQTHNIDVGGIGEITIDASGLGCSIGRTTISDSVTFEDQWKVQWDFHYEPKCTLITTTEFTASAKVVLGGYAYETLTNCESEN